MHTPKPLLVGINYHVYSNKIHLFISLYFSCVKHLCLRKMKWFGEMIKKRFWDVPPKITIRQRFFFPLRVILNLSLPYHTSWCKHFVAIVFFFFNGCHLTSIFYFSFLDYLNVISFLPKVAFSQVRVYFVKVSVFLTTLWLDQMDLSRHVLVQKLENLVHIFVAKCHYYWYAVIGSMLMYTLKQYSDYVLYYCRFLISSSVALLMLPLVGCQNY